MDIIAAAGAVRCRVIVTENREMIASADSNLRDIRHQIVRNTLRILTDASALVCAYRIKIVEAGSHSIPDVLSAMKILYSMAEFRIRDMGGQIDALVQRNTVMMDRAERLKEEDLMAGVGFLVLLPMITGVVKMLAKDLVLVILGILSVVNTI